MTQQEFFEYLLSQLDRLKIPHMITGSVGSMVFGTPRMTNDMDVVVELTKNQADSLSQAFLPPEYFFPPVESVHGDIARRGQFNIIHVKSGSKVDLIVRKDTQFAKVEFERRRPISFSSSRPSYSATPEDIILSKLRFYREGQSEKHLEDIRGMLLISGNELDREYLQKWILSLGLTEEWAKAQSF